MMLDEGKLQFGIALPQMFMDGVAAPSQIRDFLTKVEALGFHSVWTQDPVVEGIPALEPLPLLAFAAAHSSRLKLGTSVLLTAFRDPYFLAKTVAAVDQLSEGRVILGVGLGGTSRTTQGPSGPRDAYDRLGVSVSGRVTRFEEGIRIIKKLWTEERVTYPGRFWQLNDRAMKLKPIQKPHPPIWFGAHSDTALRRAVRMGDGWMGAGYFPTSAFKEEIKLVRQYLEEEGRDPGTFPLSKRVYMLIDKDKARAAAKVREWIGQLYGDVDRGLEITVFGSDEECAEGLGEVAAAGVDLILINTMYDPLEQAERLARDVIPKLG